ncbi:ABC transporter ATP-binding protein [Dactylosporangium sp. NPDC051484]|uniref:ABC transporter ATP-binding protein n=1 Tax=Dactylosporangium sp. NPDC051484 TaxID=3154942 RepID=UPI0034507606
MAGVTKYFNGRAACDDVDLSVAPGEIHGLLGQNGAGKSTLMNILLGLVRPDRGVIEVTGRPVTVRDPNDARAQGIGMVHQHYSLIPTLSVWENIAITTKGRVQPDRITALVNETSARYGLEVSASKRVGDLTVGEQQRVEIVKCLIDHPKLLILDEPTAVLTERESQALFSMLAQVVDSADCSVILISHNLAEIRSVAHQATIMRNGRVVSRLAPSETSVAVLARHMIGHDLRNEPDVATAIGADAQVTPAPVATGTATGKPGRPPALEIEEATAFLAGGRRALDALGLHVRGGEVLGVAGVEGNGQKWLASLLSGALSLHTGRVRVRGTNIRVNKPGAMRSAGVAVVPEDRRESGCVLDMSVADNIAFAALGSLARRGVVSRRRVLALAERLVDEFQIAVASLDQPMRSLSGGNQQKVVLARELSTDPSVLVLAQPTRGLDVGAIAYMHERIRAAANAGVAVVLISTDLNEIMQVSDRIAVMYRGKVRGETPRAEADSEKLGLLMGGVHA